jgi:hypothetical protein
LYAQEITFVELGLSFGAKHAWLWRRRDLAPKDPRGELCGEQFMLGSMVQVVRLAAGPHWVPASIRLESASSEWATRAADLETSGVHYGGRVLAIAVPYDLLDQRLGTAASAGTTRAPGEETLGSDDLVGSLQQALAPLVGEIPLSIKLAAELANTSARTLLRWLAQEGTSWRQIIDRSASSSVNH